MLGLQDLMGCHVNPSYVAQGVQSLNSHKSLVRTLLSERRLPEVGWGDGTIELMLQECSAMDSNNFQSNAGVGEREGRVYSSLVRRRHSQLSHGIGRSGDLDEVQPKAAGSSLMYKLTMCMAMHALQVLGVNSMNKCIVVPLATGMSLSLCLLTIRGKLSASPSPSSAPSSSSTPTEPRYVIWPRIDQKSCFKCILTAGFTPLVVENKIVGDAIETDVDAIRALLCSDAYRGKVAAILSTTSCFAPRRPDRIDAIAKLCEEHGVAHVINNAYGLQCPGISRLVNRACTVGRVDYLVSSTDKNFMVPVGGAIIASPDADKVSLVSKMYPGRASMAPIMDLFITLLSMGRSGLATLVQERLRLLPLLIERVGAVARRHGERVLVSPHNTISVGVTLSSLDSALTARDEGAEDAKNTNRKGLSFLGSMLFQRCVSGTRVIPRCGSKSIGAHHFNGWGASVEEYPYPYLTAACAIGLTVSELDCFCERLDKALGDFRKKEGLEKVGTCESGSVTTTETQGGGEDVVESLAGAWQAALAAKRW